MPSPIIKGTITTIRWGAGGVLQTPLNTAIVKSVKCSRLGGEPVKIEDNNGFTYILVMLNDGDKVEITVMDDTALTWPAFGDTLSLKKPGEASAKAFVVTDDDPALNRKQEGERTITAEYFANAFIT